MEATVFKDPLAIRFIRCVSRIPGTEINAGGAGITLQGALARCQSEVIEGAFEIHELESQGIYPLGIAAHPSLDQACNRAMHEAIETLCLQEIRAEKKFKCTFHIRIGNISLGVARTSHGYFCMIRGFLNRVPIASYAASASLLSVLLKAWEEFQSIRFFRPEGRDLKTFSKAHFLFTEEELGTLTFQFQPRHNYCPQLDALSVGMAERSGRTIVYYYKGAQS
jgi:hypothetical protein